MNVDLDNLSNLPAKSFNYINDYLQNPIIIIVLAIILLVFTFFLKDTTSNSNTSQTSFLEIMLWTIFIVLVILNGISYFYNLDVDASLTGLFKNNKKPDLKLKITQTKKKDDKHSRNNSDGEEDDDNGDNNNDNSDGDVSLSGPKQVYHIPGNSYTFNDAKAICSALNANLASYEQLENSYENGGEWCSYGWSKDQLALFPTQKSTYNSLQKIKGHEHDCGRPGINGGFIDNPYVRFGVNCFGVKPKMTPLEKQSMKVNKTLPQSKSEDKFNKQVNYWKNKIKNLQLAPFNKDQWSRY